MYNSPYTCHPNSDTVKKLNNEIRFKNGNNRPRCVKMCMETIIMHKEAFDSVLKCRKCGKCRGWTKIIW